MIKIRKSVFETNSSSMHSIIVKKESNSITEEDIRKLYLHDGVLTIWNEDELRFGRYPFRLLDSLRDKICYVLANQNDYDEEKARVKREKAEAEIKALIPEIKEIQYPEWYGETYYGDVDHQSCGLFNSLLEKENITISDFLRDKRYVVIIDGDEYAVYHRMKRAGLIDQTMIEKEYE